MFILQNAPKQHLKLPGLTLDELEFDSGTAKFDLTVDIAEVDDGLSCVSSTTPTCLSLRPSCA